MTAQADLIVLGAGPAGMAAATAAADQGVDTVVVDENATPGGQVYRALPESFTATDTGVLGPDQAIGDRLRAALAASGARIETGYKVWSAGPGPDGAGFRIEGISPDGPAGWQAPRLIAATGTTERILPFPGWTTPGVIGLAGATILLKAQRMLPGRTVVVAGVGPLVSAVAAGIIKGGGKVAAVADLAGPSEWLATLPWLASRRDLLARGIGWLWTIRSAGVPIYFRHAVAEAEGDTTLDAVTLAPVDARGRPRDGRRRRFGCDALAVGHGLVPASEVSRLLGAEHVFDPAVGGWVAVRDAEGATSVPGFYLAGDAGGVRGAASAELAGRLAGLAVARDLGRIDAHTHQGLAGAARSALERTDRFGGAMARMMRPRPGLMAMAMPDTVVCRCEDVTRAEVERAIAEGAGEVNQLKQWTRCGMGPCQGRMCGEAAAMLVAARCPGGREAAGINRARTPIRPIPVGDLVGEFDYADFWRSDAAKMALTVMPSENQSDPS